MVRRSFSDEFKRDAVAQMTGRASGAAYRQATHGRRLLMHATALP